MARETRVDTNDQAYEFFVQESMELLQHLESGLMTLVQEHEAQKIHGLMRAAHSIKGGAACIGLMAVQSIAHDLENGIRALYKEDTVFDLELENLLLQAYDALQEPIRQQIQTGEYDPDRALDKAKPIFVSLEAKLGHALSEAAELPEMQMEGDITEFIFTEEVPQALARLENFVKQPPVKSPVSDLASQLEVLATLGDMLNLEGFAAIAQAAADAVEVNGEHVVKIASLALHDFRLGQQAVVNGDRTQGGEPSQALLELTQTQPKTSQTEPEAVTNEDTVPLIQETVPTINGDRPEAETPVIDDDLELDPTELAAIQFLGEESDDESTLLFSDDELASLIIEDDEDDAGDLLTAVVEETVREPMPQVLVTNGAKPPEEPIVAAPETGPPPTELPIVKEMAVEEKEMAVEEDVSPAVAQIPESLPNKPKRDLSVGRSPSQAAPMIDTSSLSVRLDMGRLNYLNNLVGELVTQDNSALLRNKQSLDALDSLKRWFNRFNKITNQFQQYSKELVIKNPQARAQLAQFVVFASTIAEEMAQLGETIEDTTLINQQDQQNLKQRQQTIKQLEHNLLEARMLPIGDLLNRFPRTVRDLSVKSNKPVSLELEGTTTLVDRAILSKLYDPLVHLVRNAFDHGIDTPEERLAAGKSDSGTIIIKAYNRGNSTYLEVRDDGRGIDIDKIRDRAIEKGVIDADEAAAMSSAQVYELLFVPGFSTAAKVSHLSGRGVGLDAVRLQIRALKGNISITSELGKGTTFTLRLPWSMTITKLLLFRAQESFLAIPVNSLSAIAAAAPEDIKQKDNKEIFTWKGRPVPLIQDLLVGFNYPSSLIASRQQIMGTWARSNMSSIWKQAGQQMVLVISQGNDVIGIKVDQILLEQNLVIKPFGSAINPPSYISGCTVLGDGRLVTVLDGAALLERMIRKGTQKIAMIDTHMRHLKPKLVLPTVLVIDDSLTTRQTLSTTLQKAGYRVVQAQDGADGLNQLEQHPEVEGIICDVEMPQMNGFEFLGRCRKQHAKTDLPVLMLTSRGSKRYRQLAQQLGANGYLTKPYLDQELIETLQSAVAETKQSQTAAIAPS
ncbi:CheA signal transduction histidine kinase [[Leptolyngbya] sp. PCC 7376]|uniref:hybrid sensor histidine kinase/response regulator n=1 Tax=[Leptolyngbya] sp. PCC 7376 TaxID=111781 RepID=UPI00029ED3F5|nr:response regulator [[Leptolyngbya] sp. PCC 7376]AFY38017.1 CheA signal transduction histidine kinase [[Leptolyngbya] sp. PCC 7376]